MAPAQSQTATSPAGWPATLLPDQAYTIPKACCCQLQDRLLCIQLRSSETAHCAYPLLPWPAEYNLSGEFWF